VLAAYNTVNSMAALHTSKRARGDVKQTHDAASVPPCGIGRPGQVTCCAHTALLYDERREGATHDTKWHLPRAATPGRKRRLFSAVHVTFYLESAVVTPPLPGLLLRMQVYKLFCVRVQPDLGIEDQLVFGQLLLLPSPRWLQDAGHV
jgi:hypothetical protein